MTDTEKELEFRTEIALARLGVAEELRWLIAFPSAMVAHLLYHNWLLTIGIAILAIFGVPYPFSKAYDKAQDDYERFTGTGKYLEPHSLEKKPPG